MPNPLSREHLFRPSPPWLVLHPLEEAEAKWIPSYLYGGKRADVVVRKLRGSKMRDRAGLMNEFGAALQFFDGFGENAAALDECLCYLDEWLPGAAYILVISQSAELLQDMPEDMEWFLDVLNKVGVWWSKEIRDGDRFDRPPIPFHVVFECSPGELLRVQDRLGILPLIKVRVEEAGRAGAS